MGMKFKNNAWGTLAAGITSGATSITLTAGHGARFPSLAAGDYFYAALINSANTIEFIKVTARATDVLTVARGIDGSTPTAYSAGDRIELRLIKSAMDNTLQLDAANNLTGAINHAKTTVASATTPDIWTGTGGVIDYTGALIATGFAAAPQAGASRTLVLAAAAPFTAGANMLIDGVASGSTWIGAVGDRVEVIAITTTQFRLGQKKADGAAVVGGGLGTTTNDSAAAGYIGEHIESVVAAVTSGLSNSTTKNVTSVSLTAGDWDVFGIALMPASGVMAWTAMLASFSQTSAVQGAESTIGRVTETSAGDPYTAPTVTVPTLRISLASTTTIYLVVTGYFSGTNTFGVGGRISARRVR